MTVNEVFYQIVVYVNIKENRDRGRATYDIMQYNGAYIIKLC